MRRQRALSRNDLLARLERIDVEGWDGPTGDALLGYVRENLVRLQVGVAGLSGPAAEQAEATGWAVAWELLTTPAIRTAAWPWSVLQISIRRAVRGEWASGLYLAKARSAWELREAPDGPAWELTPLSWDQLVADGYEPAADAGGRDQLLLGRVVETLVDVGWDRELASTVVLRLADRAQPGPRGSVMGWRRVAAELALPPWQARRVMALLELTVAERLGLDDADPRQSRDLFARLRTLSTATTRYRGPCAHSRLAS